MIYHYFPFLFFFFLCIRHPPRSTLSSSSAASDVYKRQVYEGMDVVDTIGQTGVDENQKPTEDITINSVSIETYQ